MLAPSHAPTPVMTTQHAREHYKGREIVLYEPGRKQFAADGTTNQDAFKQWELPKREYPENTAFNTPSLKLEADTTYAQHYPKHQIEPSQYTQNQENAYYEPPKVQFNGTTSYRDQFQQPEMEKRQSFQPPAIPPSLKFEGGSTYKRDFPGHQIQNSQRLSDSQNVNYQPVNVPFEGQTSYNADFQATKLPSRPHYDPPQLPPSLPFEGTTTSKDTYIPHEIQPLNNSDINANTYQSQNIPFDGQSSYARDFQPHEMPPKQQYGTQMPTVQPLKFEGESSYTTQFKPHEIVLDPNSTGNQVNYAPPSIPFEGQSTYKSQFQEHELPARPVYEQATQQFQSPPLDDMTSYKENFKEHEIDPDRYWNNTMQAADYQAPHIPFEGTTTQKDAFVEYPIQPKQQLTNSFELPHIPFEGSTTNKEMFKQWQLPEKRLPVGVEMYGDRNYTLIPGNVDLPYTGKQVFSTTHDNQTEFSVLIVAGESQQASQNRVVGQFDLVGLLPQEKRSHQIEVSLTLDKHHVLTASARDLFSDKSQGWENMVNVS